MRGTTHAPDPHSRRGLRSGGGGAVVVVDDGVRRGPELNGEFRPEVRDWYEAWRVSPMAALFTSADWAAIRLMCPLVERYYARPSAQALAELRMFSEQLGATVVARQRARISVEHAPAVSPVEVLETRQRRRKL